MSLEDNKRVIRRFLTEGFDRQNRDVVDEVLASDHLLRGPKLGRREERGTEAIKSEIEKYTEARCTIQEQIAEGDWVATIYTIGKPREEHRGVMINRLANGKIQESFVMAREVPKSESDWTFRTIFN